MNEDDYMRALNGDKNLQDADLTRAKLTDAKVTRADLKDGYLKGCRDP